MNAQRYKKYNGATLTATHPLHRTVRDRIKHAIDISSGTPKIMMQGGCVVAVCRTPDMIGDLSTGMRMDDNVWTPVVIVGADEHSEIPISIIRATMREIASALGSIRTQRKMRR